MATIFHIDWYCYILVEELSCSRYSHFEFNKISYVLLLIYIIYVLFCIINSRLLLLLLTYRLDCLYNYSYGQDHSSHGANYNNGTTSYAENLYAKFFNNGNKYYIIIFYERYGQLQKGPGQRSDLQFLITCPMQ